MDDFREFFIEFRSVVRRAPHSQLKELSKELRAVTRRRFISGRAPVCENVEHGFTEGELQRFFDVVQDQEDRMCFMFMVALGLRPNELARLRGRDLQGSTLLVPSSKGGTILPLRLPRELLKLLRPCRPHEKLFPRSAKQLRDRFGMYRSMAALDETYGWSKPQGRYGHCRRLFRFSLKSFRHYGIQRIEKLTNSADIARRYARHRKIQTTVTYFRKCRRQELERVLPDVVSPLFS